MNKQISGLKFFCKLIGRKAILATGVGLCLSFLLGIIELVNVGFLQLLMKNFGLSVGSLRMGSFELPNLSLTGVLIGMLAVGFLRFICQMISNQSLAFASETMNLRLKNIALFDMLYKVSPDFVGAAEIFYRFTEVIPKMVGAIATSFNMTSILIQLIVIFGMMFISLPLISIAALAGIVFIGLMSLYITRSIRPLSIAVNAESKTLAIRVQRATRNLRFFDIMRTQELEYRYLSQTVANLGQYVLRLNVFSTLISTLTPFLGMMLIALIIYLAQSMTAASGAVLVAFLYLMLRFIQNLAVFSQQASQLFSYAGQFSHGKKYMKNFSIQQLQEALSRSSKLQFVGSDKVIDFDIKKHRASFQQLNDFPPKIDIEGLFYQYSSDQGHVLKNISMSIPSGGALAVTGASGSGKSTLLMLILGIYQPSQGRIKIDELSPADFFGGSSRRIGYVGAEPYLIKGSIEDNLLYGVRGEVSVEDLHQALRAAHLDSFVEKVGLDYEIQEDYSGISAGQRQRLCLARALLNKPKLLILDEATANLDSLSEEIIRENIENLKGICTVIIVSHKDSFIRDVKQRIAL